MMLTPNRPSPTTQSPITAPPRNATDKAAAIPFSFAAFAVLTFALVATVIPQKPAIIEKKAPIKKQIAVVQPIANPTATNTMTIMIARILYSANKNARAPSWIAAAISFIRSVPSDCFFTLAANPAATNNAMMPMIGIIIVQVMMY